MTTPETEDPYITSLRQEALALPDGERVAQMALIAELTGELAVVGEVAPPEVFELGSELDAAEYAQAEAQRYIDEARAMARGGRVKAETENSPASVDIDFDKIGWIREEGVQSVEAKTVETPELTYDLIDLTGKSPAARSALKKLETQSDSGGGNMVERLMQTVEETVVPKIHRGVLQGNNVRSVSIGARNRAQATKSRSMNTSYPAYKEGVFGPKNRVLLVRVDGKDSQRPAYAIAALYDHDDEAPIHREQFLM